MANIRSFPNNQDEYIGAEHVMRWHHGRSSGVFGADGNAAVTAVLGTMAVAVSDGTGWIANENADGIVWWVDNEKETGSKLQLSVDMADAALPRIDRVIVSWQTTNYVALPEVKILKGVPSSAPVAPELTNDGLERQISLAAITIPAGTTAITGSMISDERLDDSVCGLVTGEVGIDTTVMREQFETFMQESIERQLEYIAQQQTSWDAFFEHVAHDTLVPVPVIEDKGKVIVVNATGDGYTLGAAQTEIPITADPPADSDIWIDPDEDTPEAGHILDRNNPHGVTAEQAGAFPNCVSIRTTGTDLNDYKTDGWYFFAHDYAPKNTPAGSDGWLQVITGKDKYYAKQIWYRLGTAGSNDHGTWIRTYTASGSTWGAWAEIYTSKHTAFKGADSTSQVSLQSAPAATGGAGLWVYGVDHANAGQFRLQTYNKSSSTYYQLQGTPDGTLKWDGSLYVNNTTDASSTADKNPALILGNRAGEHIVIDGNEIIPKSGATSAGTLYLGDGESTVISISGAFRVNSYTYGNSLPNAGTAGRIFFKKV